MIGDKFHTVMQCQHFSILRAKFIEAISDNCPHEINAFNDYTIYILFSCFVKDITVIFASAVFEILE